jgi:hypothetical protein
MRTALLAMTVICSWLGAVAGERLHLVRPTAYAGMADASGGVTLSSNLFAVANDEDNILRIYRLDDTNGPVKQFDVNAFLQVEGKSLEADLEAAARIGDRIFWIGSHGRNRVGKERLNRCRLFATEIQGSGDNLLLQPVGAPYKRLLEDLNADSRFARFGLAEAARYTPKEFDALNIEGLCATSEGHLLIGFRNPIPEGNALLIPLLNPNEVISGRSPQFGAPIQLDLGGRGIRDLVYYQGSYMISAGSYNGRRDFELYRWSGPNSTPEPLRVKHLNRYNPEGILIYPDKGWREIQILSDDGTRPIEGIPAKQFPDPRRRTFRSFWLSTAAESRL